MAPGSATTNINMENKKMKNLIAAVLALLVGVSSASALSVSVAGGKKALARTLDSSGYPIGINDDKGWKVFEIIGTTEVQVLDEVSVAPKQGILNRVCVETGVLSVDYALVWDTTAATGLAGANRRLMPAQYSGTSSIFNCTPALNALFTAGLRGANSSSQGHMYIYWRGLGDVR